MSTNDNLEVLSEVIGWIYFTAWSVSFYTQVILNYQRKSVVGLSFDFLTYNAIGFFAYSVYNIYYLYGEKKDSIKVNDVFFSVHALVLTLFTVGQCAVYENNGQRPSKICYGVSLSFVFTMIVALILGGTDSVEWATSIDIYGYVKTAVSFVKYVPQAYINYNRKSTAGWSIHNILLDIIGGVLSFLQLLIDAEIEDDYSELTSNIPKLILSIETIFFDLLFIVQHYILYSDNHGILLDKSQYEEIESDYVH